MNWPMRTFRAPPSRKQVISSAPDSEESEYVFPLLGEPVDKKLSTFIKQKFVILEYPFLGVVLGVECLGSARNSAIVVWICKVQH